MEAELKREILKQDLQIMHNKLDGYLDTLLSAATELIAREGITLAESVEDGMLLVMYAAYLYRKRADPVAAMPRMLRYALNNRLVSQRMGGADAT